MSSLLYSEVPPIPGGRSLATPCASVAGPVVWNYLCDHVSAAMMSLAANQERVSAGALTKTVRRVYVPLKRLERRNAELKAVSPMSQSVSPSSVLRRRLFIFNRGWKCVIIVGNVEKRGAYCKYPRAHINLRLVCARVCVWCRSE